MTPDKIEAYIIKKERKNVAVNIHFKDRNTVTGLFIRGNDYDELKAKNFWRIVNNPNLEEWKQTKNEGLAKIYSGGAFTRLSDDN